MQVAPFAQVSLQQLLVPHPAQVGSHEPPNPPTPVVAELLAAVVPAPPMPVVELEAPPAVDVVDVAVAPPAPEEADSDEEPPADEAVAPVPGRPWSGSVQLDAASSASRRDAAASAKARATRGRDIGAG